MKMGDLLDFDEEARKLFAALKVGDASRAGEGPGGRYSNLDAVWEHPEHKTRIYVGNIRAAENAGILRSHGVTRVVNCQDKSSRNFHENDPDFKYFRFPVANWWRAKLDSDQAVLTYFGELFAWIENELCQGNNVMVHCLAGAHRAGTTGVALVMHFARLDFPTALSLCKARRPIVNPIGQLPELLRKLERAYFNSNFYNAGEKR